MAGDDPMMPMPASKTAPCNRACRFAYPGEEAVYCQKHKMNGMVDVVNPSCKVLYCFWWGGAGVGGVVVFFCVSCAFVERASWTVVLSVIISLKSVKIIKSLFCRWHFLESSVC